MVSRDATGELARLPTLRSQCGEAFALCENIDATACEFILKGGDGVIGDQQCGSQRNEPTVFAALMGDTDQALAINEQLMPMHRSLFIESNPIPVKRAAARLGLIATAELRLPLTPLGLDAQRWRSRP